MRCANCTGELFYNAEVDMLECERCSSKFPIVEKKTENIKRKYDPSYSILANQDEVVDYKCATCGTKLLVGSDNEVRRCSSCGNTTLMRERSNIVKPDGIIPFSISKRKAAEIFRKWVGERKFAPKDLKYMAKLEKISGISISFSVKNVGYGEV